VESGRPPAPPAPAAVTAPASRRGRDISWTGLAGGALGVLLPLQSGLYLVVLPGDSSRLAAIPLFFIGLLWVPAVWVSVRATPIRRRTLRTILAVSLPLVVAGVVLYGPQFATLLLIPSTLLAIASGLVFQGRQR